MSRDPVWDAMKNFSAEKKAHDTRMYLEHARVLDDGGWTKHSPHHWTRKVRGKSIQYWPGQNKFQDIHSKIRYNEDVYEYIRRMK